MPAGYTYIMGSHTGTLYIGVTSDLYTRVKQHKNGTFEGFSKKYGGWPDHGCPVHDAHLAA